MAVEAVGARVREADARQGTACPRAVEDLVAAVQIRAAQLVQVVVVEDGVGARPAPLFIMRIGRCWRTQAR